MKIHFYLDDGISSHKDQKNFVILDLPCIPRRGDIVHIDEDITMNEIGGFDLEPSGYDKDQVHDCVFVSNILFEIVPGKSITTDRFENICKIYISLSMNI